MISFSAVLFFTCLALTAANPLLFAVHVPNQQEPENHRAGPYEQAAEAAYSAPFYPAGGDSEADNSAEDDTGASLGGGGGTSEEIENEVDTTDGPDAGESEFEAGGAAVQGAAGTNKNAVPVGGNEVGNNPSTLAPNHLGGGPGLIVNSDQDKSVAGRNAGIAIGCLGLVALVAGGAFFLYKKRRTEAYGSRF